MSLTVTVYVNEGIIMASDSRTTYAKTSKSGPQQIGVHINNSTQKTFLCPNQAGISTCGDAAVQRKPITGFIEAFIRENIKETTRVEDMPEMILAYFDGLGPRTKTNFTIAGYRNHEGKKEQKVYKIKLLDGSVEEMETQNPGAAWDGETMVLIKLLQPVCLKGREGNIIDLPHPDISWNFFTLQDAIDFANYAIKTTIDTMHFQSVVETVGGDVDILVLKPEGSFWIKKKELHG